MTLVAEQRAPARRVRLSRWDLARLVLLACMATAFLGCLAFGQRASSYADLESALSAGTVHTVSVAGGMSADDSGFVTQRLQWRQGLVRYQTTVLQVQGDSTGADHDGVTAVLHREAGSQLAEEHPGLRIIRVQPQGDDELPGFAAPQWIRLLVIGAALSTLWLLINGPQPRVATRWAWFWLLACPWTWPVFLLLSGQVPLPERLRERLPSAPTRPWRLTGGWALLLSIPLTAMLGRIW